MVIMRKATLRDSGVYMNVGVEGSTPIMSRRQQSFVKAVVYAHIYAVYILYQRFLTANITVTDLSLLCELTTASPFWTF